jgi:hypothetical protein
VARSDSGFSWRWHTACGEQKQETFQRSQSVRYELKPAPPELQSKRYQNRWTLLTRKTIQWRVLDVTRNRGADTGV